MSSKNIFLDNCFWGLLGVVILSNTQIFGAAEWQPTQSQIEHYNKIIDDFDRLYGEASALAIDLQDWDAGSKLEQLSNLFNPHAVKISGALDPLKIQRKLDMMEQMIGWLGQVQEMYNRLSKRIQVQPPQPISGLAKPSSAFAPSQQASANVPIAEYNNLIDTLVEEYYATKNQAVGLKDLAAVKELEKLYNEFKPYLSKIEATEESYRIQSKLRNIKSKLEHFLAAIASIHQNLKREESRAARQQVRPAQPPSAVQRAPITRARQTEYIRDARHLDVQHLIEALQQDIKKFDNPERPVLTWCVCANATLPLRLQLAAQVAVDAKNQFAGKETLNITSFAAGGVGSLFGGGAQLLQEFVILDALFRVWPKDKKLAIILSLIGPELQKLVSPGERQTGLLQREIRDLLARLNREGDITLNVLTFNSYRDYLDRIQHNPISNQIFCLL